MTYEQLKQRIRALIADGSLDKWPSDEQRADFAYGNAKIENDDVTREIAERAVEKMRGER